MKPIPVAECESIFNQEERRGSGYTHKEWKWCAANVLLLACRRPEGYWGYAGKDTNGYDMDQPIGLKFLDQATMGLSFRSLDPEELKEHIASLKEVITEDSSKKLEDILETYQKNKYSLEHFEKATRAFFTTFLDAYINSLHTGLSETSSFSAICYVLITKLELKVQRETYKKIVYSCDFSTPFSVTSVVTSVASALGLYKTEDRRAREIAAIDKLYPQQPEEMKQAQPTSVGLKLRKSAQVNPS